MNIFINIYFCDISIRFHPVKTLAMPTSRWVCWNFPADIDSSSFFNQRKVSFIKLRSSPFQKYVREAHVNCPLCWRYRFSCVVKYRFCFWNCRELREPSRGRALANPANWAKAILSRRGDQQRGQQPLTFIIISQSSTKLLFLLGHPVLATLLEIFVGDFHAFHFISIDEQQVGHFSCSSLPR